MNTETQKPKAGRPKLPDSQRKVRIVAYVPPDVAQIVEDRGGSAYVERTLRRHASQQPAR